MDTIKLQICLEKKLALPLESLLAPHQPNRPFYSLLPAATLAKNIESLGFTFGQGLLFSLAHYDEKVVSEFGHKLIPILKKMMGANVKYRPMYPNFPQQVMDASSLELYLNAIVHYWSSGNLFPLYIKENREPLQEKVDLKVINLMSDNAFYNIFTQLVGSNTSLSASDKEVVEKFCANYGKDVVEYIPESIPQKENLALVVGEFIKNKLPLDHFIGKVKTATDLLRIAVQMSGGDISLAKPTKFVKMGRPLRRFFLANLNVMNNPTPDMGRYPNEWVRLGERLHPGDYATTYPNTFKAFKDIREGNYTTDNASIEFLLHMGSTDFAIAALKQRPGDFARRFADTYKKLNSKKVVKAFVEVADKVSTPVLLTLQNYLVNYGNGLPEQRMFCPKGSLAKAQVVPNNLPIMNTEDVCTVSHAIDTTLMQRFAKLTSLGKVYIDPELSNYFLPTAQRSATKSLKTISRGSKINLPDKDIVRLFLWWKNANLDGYSQRTDIDLSAELYDSKWNNQGHCSFHCLRISGLTHSGDITDATNGACEFIDVDIPKTLKSGVRYVVMMLNSYSAQNFCDLPECFAGFMGREDGQKGKIFEPSTVVNKFDLAMQSTIGIPAVFDLETRKFIWVDMTLKNTNLFNTVGGKNGNNAMNIVKAFVEMNKPTVYDLLSIHAHSRGIPVDNPAEADTIYSVNDGFQFNADLINSEYLV